MHLQDVCQPPLKQMKKKTKTGSDTPASIEVANFLVVSYVLVGLSTPAK